MTTETNVERLESAKRLITAVREANSIDDPKKFWSSLLDLFGFGYLDSLLQQAERAEELEKSIKGFAMAVEIYSEMPVDEAMKQLIELAQEDSQ